MFKDLYIFNTSAQSFLFMQFLHKQIIGLKLSMVSALTRDLCRGKL